MVYEIIFNLKKIFSKLAALFIVLTLVSGCTVPQQPENGEDEERDLLFVLDYDEDLFYAWDDDILVSAILITGRLDIVQVIRLSHDGVLESVIGESSGYTCSTCGRFFSFWLDENFHLKNIRESIKIQLTEEQLQEFVELTNKITEEDMGEFLWNQALSFAHVIYNGEVYEHHFFPVFNDYTIPIENEFRLEKLVPPEFTGEVRHYLPMNVPLLNPNDFVFTPREHMIEIVRQLIELSSTTLEWYIT